MFFGSWQDLLRVAVVGSLAYFGLVALLRISGKRTLAKMNAFDFLVTVAMGSTLATAFLSRDVELAEAIMAFAMLILLQFVVTWLSLRWRSFRKLVRA